MEYVKLKEKLKSDWFFSSECLLQMRRLQISDRELFAKYYSANPYLNQYFIPDFAGLIFRNQFQANKIFWTEINNFLCVFVVVEAKIKRSIFLLFEPISLTPNPSDNEIKAVLKKVRGIFSELNFEVDLVPDAKGNSILAATEEFCQRYTQIFPQEKLVSISCDFIYDLNVLAKLEGSKFATIRYNAKRIDRTKPNLSIRNYQDADFFKTIGFIDKYIAQKQNNINTPYNQNLTVLTLGSLLFYQELDLDVCVIFDQEKEAVVGLNTARKTFDQSRIISFLKFCDFEIKGLNDWLHQQLAKRYLPLNYLNAGPAVTIGLTQHKKMYLPSYKYNFLVPLW